MVKLVLADGMLNPSTEIGPTFLQNEISMATHQLTPDILVPFSAILSANRKASIGDTSSVWTNQDTESFLGSAAAA